MPQAVVTRARLKARAKELSAILSSAGSSVSSELLLADEENHFFGILDIVAPGPGPGGLIIDLKTGRDSSAAPSPAIEHQMLFYAHLFQATYGMPPARVIIFGLQRGPAEIEAAPTAITALLNQIRAAQLDESGMARPHVDACRYCPKRTTCEPHWDAVSAWDRPDAIEGMIRSVEYSSSGAAALLIGKQWLTGIPTSKLPGSVSPGQFARAVRVRRRNNNLPAEWAATSSTLISFEPSR